MVLILGLIGCSSSSDFGWFTDVGWLPVYKEFGKEFYLLMRLEEEEGSKYFMFFLLFYFV